MEHFGQLYSLADILLALACVLRLSSLDSTRELVAGDWAGARTEDGTDGAAGAAVHWPWLDDAAWYNAQRSRAPALSPVHEVDVEALVSTLYIFHQVHGSTRRFPIGSVYAMDCR